MTQNQLFTRLNELCKQMNYSYDINSGGCCFVAACIAENLERHKIPFKIIHYDLWGCHYAIKVSDRYLNRDNYVKKEISDILDKDSEWLYELYYNKDWNDCYNKRWNLIVSTRIRALFYKYENSRT